MIDRGRLRAVVPLPLDEATVLVDADKFLAWLDGFEANPGSEWCRETGEYLINKVNNALGEEHD